MNNESFANAERSIKQHVVDVNNSIDGIVGSLFEIIEERKNTLDSIKTLGNEVSLKKQFEVLANKIEAISKTADITKEELKRYTDSVSEKELLLKKQSIINQDISILQAVTPSVNSVQLIDAKLSNLSKGIYDEIRDKYEEVGAESLKQIIDSQIEVLRKNTKNLVEEIKDKTDIIDRLKTKAEQHAESIKIAKRQKDIEASLKKIADQKSKLADYEKEFNQKLSEIEKKHGEYRIGIQRILSTIDKIEFDYLKIDYQTTPKPNAYDQFIDRNINMNKLKQMDVLSKKFLDERIVEKGSISAIIRDIIDEKIYLKSSARGKKEVVKELLENVESINYLDSIKTKDGKTSFKNMTGGQKAIAVLELLLKFDTSKYPILIDQPEDDLDADGISLHLTGFIKRQAHERQFIIVTHNASLVVNADSDNVIVAVPPRGNHGFTFFNGAIENSDISKQIMNIMEGGEVVLKQRINKLMASQ